MTAERYRQQILEPFFHELHDDELQVGYFQQDGATPHCTRETLELLREFFDNRIISRNTENEYPPRSCDITPCDFFLWPYLKNTIFRTPINDLEELKEKIRERINEINNTPQMLSNVSQSIRRRILKCYEEGGGHFTHVL